MTKVNDYNNDKKAVEKFVTNTRENNLDEIVVWGQKSNNRTEKNSLGLNMNVTRLIKLDNLITDQTTHINISSFKKLDLLQGLCG